MRARLRRELRRSAKLSRAVERCPHTIFNIWHAPVKKLLKRGEPVVLYRCGGKAMPQFLHHEPINVEKMPKYLIKSPSQNEDSNPIPHGLFSLLHARSDRKDSGLFL